LVGFHFAQRAVCAAAIRLRADVDNVRRGLEERLRVAPEPLLRPKTEIAASSHLLTHFDISCVVR
jgi:hypothetical protein